MFESEVNLGAQLLADSGMPVWYLAVDLEALEMNEVDGCVLGQLFGHYAVGCQRLWPDSRTEGVNEERYPLSTPQQDELAADHGFNLHEKRHSEADEQAWHRSMELLTEAWVNKALEMRDKYAAHA